MDIKEKEELQRHIRTMLFAIMRSGLDAVVLSAIGCGEGGHPPEEVATMFKREMFRVGEKLPMILFAILSPEKSDGLDNCQIFEKILVQPRGVDKTWVTAGYTWFNPVMAQAGEDLETAKEALMDAGGSGGTLSSKPTGKDITMLPSPTDDVPMGITSSASDSGTQKADTSGASGPATYHSADADSRLEKPLGDSLVLPVTSRSVFSQPRSSGDSMSLIISRKKPPASLVRLHERTQEVAIHQIEGSSCIDAASEGLTHCYILKMNETIKWRNNWDACSEKIVEHQEVKHVMGLDLEGIGI